MRVFGFALLAIAATLAADAQTPLLPQPDARLPQFEVATIKPASADYLGIYLRSGGRVIGGNCTVRYLAEEAFHLSQSRISGGPGWIDSARFDLEAIPPDDSGARRFEPPSSNFPMIDEQRLMLQALLRDRFGLRYHVARIEQPVFFLRRNGKPLKLASPRDPKGGIFMSVIRHVGGKEDGEIEGENTTMAYTALRLSAILQRTVIDQTGLAGAYDFHVDAPDESNADITDAAFEGMKTLGLELKSGKAPVDTIVIDQVTPPTPN